MRMLLRWSESSLSMTTPSPEKAEPSRCMAGLLLHRLFRRCLKIARIDRLEIRLLNAEIFQATLRGDNLGRGFRPYVPVRLDANFVDADFLDSADTRNEREPLGQSIAFGLDLDDVAATKHMPAKLGDRAHQHDAPTVEECDPIANALHP